MSDPTQMYSQERIVHHLENSSPTKYMWSFSKSPRFPPIDRRGKSDAIYDFPRFGRAPKAGIGYGYKSDFTKTVLVTEISGDKRDYDEGRLRGFRFSFGLARDKFEKAVCPGYKNLDLNVPGPAKYMVIKPTGSDSPKYTLHDRTTGWKNDTLSNPGPGAYMPITKITENGRYPDSRVANVKASNFGVDGTDRWRHYRCK